MVKKLPDFGAEVYTPDLCDNCKAQDNERQCHIMYSAGTCPKVKRK